MYWYEYYIVYTSDLHDKYSVSIIVITVMFLCKATAILMFSFIIKTCCLNLSIFSKIKCETVLSPHLPGIHGRQQLSLKSLRFNFTAALVSKRLLFPTLRHSNLNYQRKTLHLQNLSVKCVTTWVWLQQKEVSLESHPKLRYFILSLPCQELVRCEGGSGSLLLEQIN